MTATPETTTDPVRDLHEAALEGAIRLSIRCGKSRDPKETWAYAEGASMSWAFYRAMERLGEMDPEGTKGFAAELIDELEMANYGDIMCDVAEGLGFDSDKWVEHEYEPSRQVEPISDAFPEGAAIVRLKAALSEFRSKRQDNPLADDLDTAIKFVEFTRADIAQLRKAWAAISGCLIKQGRHEYLTDADLADVPSSHQPFLLGRDAMRRELLAVTKERNELREGGK